MSNKTLITRWIQKKFFFVVCGYWDELYFEHTAWNFTEALEWISCYNSSAVAQLFFKQQLIALKG